MPSVISRLRRSTNTDAKGKGKGLYEEVEKLNLAAPSQTPTNYISRGTGDVRTGKTGKEVRRREGQPKYSRDRLEDKTDLLLSTLSEIYSFLQTPSNPTRNENFDRQDFLHKHAVLKEELDSLKEGLERNSENGFFRIFKASKRAKPDYTVELQDKEHAVHNLHRDSKGFSRRIQTTGYAVSDPLIPSTALVKDVDEVGLKVWDDAVAMLEEAASGFIVRCERLPPRPDSSIYRGFLKVSETDNDANSDVVAVKQYMTNVSDQGDGSTVKANPVDCKRRAFREALIWRKVSKHPNVLRLRGLYCEESDKEKTPFLVSDWAEEGTITVFLNQKDQQNRRFAPLLLKGVLDALVELHSGAVAIEDIASTGENSPQKGNVLVTRKSYVSDSGDLPSNLGTRSDAHNGEPRSLLSDFGLSGTMNDRGIGATFMSGWSYARAPEAQSMFDKSEAARTSTNVPNLTAEDIESRQLAMEKIDVYAFGLLAYEVLTGVQWKFNSGNLREHDYILQTSPEMIKRNPPPRVPANFPYFPAFEEFKKSEKGSEKDLYDSLSACWDFDPEKRPTMAEFQQDYDDFFPLLDKFYRQLPEVHGSQKQGAWQ